MYELIEMILFALKLVIVFVVVYTVLSMVALAVGL